MVDDIHNDKGCAVVLRVINTDLVCVQNRFLECQYATEELVQTCLRQLITACKKYGIPWEASILITHLLWSERRILFSQS